ncbi:MAG: NAD(P)-dependent dehydrogenase (short-subunit alcohol dehydrogenase family) [Flavobacteriaceae bacterium]|jgi:NAD(P)-dependent dehydrogenase (short-subunit alcohol dehydrogenase family)
MDLELREKVVFITGSTAGIGFATAKALLNEGAIVILNGRASSSLDTAVKSLQHEFPEETISGIVANFNKLNEVNDLLESLPKIDILINNVGVYSSDSFFETDDEEWYRQFEVNVMSGIRLSKKIMPSMLANNWGRILFISSECASLTPPDLIPYSMTKAGVLAISRGLAQLTKGTNVTVNAVIPGSTLSEGANQFLEDAALKERKTKNQIENTFFTEVRTTSLLQRFAKVEEVAHTITYLASPRSSATNGSSIKVDGGSSGGLF